MSKVRCRIRRSSEFLFISHPYFLLIIHISCLSATGCYPVGESSSSSSSSVQPAGSPPFSLTPVAASSAGEEEKEERS